MLLVGGGIYAFVQGKKRSKTFAHTLDRLVLKPEYSPLIGFDGRFEFAGRVSTHMMAVCGG